MSTDDSAPLDIPNTVLTERLREIWRVRCELDCEPYQTFEEFYLRSCEGWHLGTPATVNARALAAILFDRARTHWPDYYSPADLPAVAVWGELLDRDVPTATPDVINRAVDRVATAHYEPPHGPYYFLRAIKAELQREGAA